VEEENQGNQQTQVHLENGSEVLVVAVLVARWWQWWTDGGGVIFASVFVCPDNNF